MLKGMKHESMKIATARMFAAADLERRNIFRG